MEANFDELVGKVFDFYGVDMNCFKLNNVVYEAIESEEDDWRSMLGCVEVRDVDGKIFFCIPLAKVTIEHSDEDGDWYRLVDCADGHVWLQFGTDYSVDWYPCFRFDYEPKLAQA